MKLVIYSLCKNEMSILPFVKDYWDRLKPEKAVVWDNGSDDGSIEFLSSIPYVEVRHFDTGGKLNDVMNAYIKNNCWKEDKGKYDYAIISDMDEVVFGDLEALQGDIIGLPWYTLVNDSKPSYEEGKLLHEVTDKWVRHESYGKFLIFNINKFDEINFSVGAHLINPIPNAEIASSDKAIVLHINGGFGAEYKVKKYHDGYKNFSDVNLKYRLGWHYNQPSEKIIEEYREMQKKAVSLKGLFK
jgi:hypothetical protein